MYSYSSKRIIENELFPSPETVSSVNDRMVFRTFPVTSGFNMEAEPRNKRFPTSTFSSGFQSSGTTRMPDRVELYEGNRLLSDEQIQRFISNTVLPHHRTLINTKGGNQAQTGSSRTQPSFQKKIKTNHALPINTGGLLGRPVLQGNPVFISVPQEAQRGSQGCRMDFPDKTQGELTGLPGEFTVPIERQRFVIPQETLMNNFSVPLSTATQVVNNNQEDISNPKCTSEGNSKYPKGIQEMTNCFPQGPEREIFRVPTMTTGEIIHIPQGNGATQETIEKSINFPQGTQPLSGGTSSSEETEDDIIIIHEGTPEELLSVVQETLQEIMSVPQGISVPQKTIEEIMGFPQGITVPQGALEATIANPQGTTIPQLEIIEETFAIPEGTTIPREIIEETTAVPQKTTIPHEIIEATFAIPEGTTFPQDIKEETTAIPQRITIPHEIVEETAAINTGNCRKRRKSSSSESTFGKRQRLDLQTNEDIEQSERLSEENRDAGKMVLPGRNPEDEKFFASIEKCLELSSEAFSSKETYASLDHLNSASLESFPTKVIDDIYIDTFESDCFLTSSDDFVLDSLSFLKQGVLDSLC